MLCPVCQANNRDARSYCHACAVPLVAMTCPGCGFDNEAGERFCGGCAREAGVRGEVAYAPGASAPRTAGATSLPTPTRPDAHAAERRQMTVLFCDMVGSTALSAELDAEVLRELIGRFQDACAAAVARHDGFIARYMGDGMLVYFGYPRAHEDSPERAVRAGLDIVRAVAALGAEPVRPEVRVGIATGTVVVGDLIGEGVSEERAVVGETPNLAARLQGLAEPGSVVISPRTQRLVRRSFELADLGEHELKGFPEPVRAWRALAATARRASTEQLLPLLGRDLERKLLEERWRAATRGEGGAVALAGDAGTGKTHLIDTFLAEVAAADDAPTEIVRYACASHQASATLHPITEHLTRAADIQLDDPPTVRADKLRAWVTRWSSELDTDLAALSQLLGLEIGDRDESTSPEERRRELLSSLCRYLLTRAEGRAAVVVFEDVQWADTTTLELIERVLQANAERPVLIVVSYRADFTPPWRDDAGLASFTLGRLRPGPARALVAAVARDTPLSDDIIETIVRRADGVPGYLVELTRAVVQQDTTDERGADAAQRLVPESLHDSLAAQLDALGPARVVAQTAAVLGRTFPRELLRRVVTTQADALDERLAQLEDAGVLQATGTEPGAPLAFRHALLADLAYDSLLKNDLRALHDRTATVLLDELPAAAEADPVQTARHLSGAGREREAGLWWHKAAQRAAAQASFLESVDLGRRAVVSLEAAIDANDGKDVCLVAPLLIEHANRLRFTRDLEEAEGVLDRAEALLAPHDLPATLSHVFFVRGNLAFNEGDVARCTGAHQRGLELAEQSGDARARARALGGVFDAKQLEGDRPRAADMGLRCVEFAMEHGFEDIAAANAAATAFSCIAALRSDDGYRMARLADELAVRAAQPRARMVALNGRALIAADRLDHEDAEAALHAREEVVGNDGSSAGMWFIDHRVLRVQGRWRDAHERAADGLERSQRSRTQLGGSNRWDAVLKSCLLAECPADRLRPLLEEVSLVAEEGAANLVGWLVAGVFEGLLHRRDFPLLAEALARLEPHVNPEHAPRLALWRDTARLALRWHADPADADTLTELQRFADDAYARDVASIALSLRELVGDDAATAAQGAAATA